LSWMVGYIPRRLTVTDLSSNRTESRARVETNAPSRWTQNVSVGIFTILLMEMEMSV